MRVCVPRMHSPPGRGACWLRKGHRQLMPSPPTRGFGYRRPSRQQPCWQRSYLPAQRLVLPPCHRPQGPGAKVALAIAGGGAGRPGRLLSQRAARCSTAPGTPSIRPQSWVFMASKRCFTFTSPPTSNPSRRSQEVSQSNRLAEPGSHLPSPAGRASDLPGQQRRQGARRCTQLSQTYATQQTLR